jgi:choice-of-anchor B domain-containing protein
MKQFLFFLLLLFIYTNVYAQFNTTLVGQLNPRPQAGYNDIWGYVDGNGIEYALLGARDGFSIISLANPANPVQVAFFPGQFTTWRDIKVYQHYAYVVSDMTTEGLWIIDLSQLPASATLVNAQTTYFQRAHNIFIDNGYAYVIGTEAGGGMHILNLANPTNPVRTAYYTQSGYIHDVYVWNDSVIACAGSSQSYHLIDVTNKTNPVLVSASAPMPGIYAHSGWMTEDKRYFIGAEEFNVRDIMIFDLQDRTTWDPIVPEYQLPGGSRIHNVFVKGNYAHISYYGEGYVVLDISNPAAPVFVGQYDTYGGSNGGFDGAWGCYPFLPSGKILVSDTFTGLYVINFTPQDVAPVIIHTPLTLIMEPGPVNIIANIADDGSVTETRLYYRVAGSTPGNWTSVNGNLFGNNYLFQIPSQQHLTRVEYYLAARDNTGNVTTLPAGGSGIPAGINPPAQFFSYETVFAGIPVITSYSPSSDTSIARNGRVNFEISAYDTTQLTISYQWKKNGTAVAQTAAYAYISPSFHPAPRVDTILVEVTNGYRSVFKSWRVYVENITSVEDNLLLTYDLHQNYPNPFNPSTNLRFSLPKEEFVIISIYNSIGEKVVDLVNHQMNGGIHQLSFDAVSLTSGIYYARISAGEFNKTIKMNLLK